MDFDDAIVFLCKFVGVMKNLVKYLLVFMIVAFFHAAGRIATISVDDSSGIDIEDVVSDDSFESPDAELSAHS